MYNEEFKKYQMLSEQYYGKNKMTLAIEKEFEIIKDILIKGGSTNITSITEVDSHVENIALYLKELFNFYKVDITVKNIGTFNAYTFAVSAGDIGKGPLYGKEKNKKYGGIQYTDEAKRNCVVTLSVEIIKHEKVTPAMMTAILLHEIGHNFYIENTISFTVTHSIFLLTNCICPVFTLLTTNTGKGIMINIRSYFKDSIIAKYFKLVSNAFQQINSVLISISVVTGAVSTFLRNFDILRNISMVIANPATLFTNQNTYNNELFADNFATSYGYGPEIITMSKMFDESFYTETLQNASKNKFTKAFLDIALNMPKITNNFDIFKNRADTATRAIDQIKYLEANLNNIENKEHREYLKKDIQLAKKQLEEYQKGIDDMPIQSSINKTTFNNGGELAYTMRQRHYDNKGSWKNLI